MWYKILIANLILFFCSSQNIKAQYCEPSYELTIQFVNIIDLDEAMISLQNDSTSIYIQTPDNSKSDIKSLLIENLGSKNSTNDSITVYEIRYYKILPNNSLYIYYAWKTHSYFASNVQQTASINIKVLKNERKPDNLPIYHLLFTHKFCETFIQYRI